MIDIIDFVATDAQSVSLGYSPVYLTTYTNWIETQANSLSTWADATAGNSYNWITMVIFTYLNPLVWTTTTLAIYGDIWVWFKGVFNITT